MVESKVALKVEYLAVKMAESKAVWMVSKMVEYLESTKAVEKAVEMVAS